MNEFTAGSSARLRGVGGALLLLSLLGAGSGAVRAVPQEDERRLWDTEFLQRRQAAKTPAPAPGGGRTKPAYRRVTPKPDAVVEQAPGEMLGVTIWSLRPSRTGDSQDSRLLLLEDDKDDHTEWTPKRVEADTAFAAGDRVRLSIESPRDGYLYVIDREQYADGTVSDPYLIFPTQRIRGGSNAVGAGQVVELPDKRAFLLKPMRPDYTGETLTMLVTQEPIPEVTVGPRIEKIDAKLLERWERQWAATTERFEMVGGAGRSYTKAEKEAGAEGRLLTQEDDLPQTLFRVVAKPGTPLLVGVGLKIGK